jgi:uncharacterized BrkB/YihY/UPF0761 family membrane protein
VSTVLSLLAFVAYVALIVGFAAGITWVVVRLTPPQKKTDGPAGS